MEPFMVIAGRFRRCWRSRRYFRTEDPMRDVHVRVVAVVVTVMALVLTGDEPRAAQGQVESEYEIRILRGLGGNDARGNSINEWGMVSGYSTREGDPTRRAMAWIVGRPFELGDLDRVF
jgi:hypothetical protein